MAESYKAFKKVYATVTSEVYSKFRKRVMSEGVDMNDALAGLVTLFANGGDVVVSESGRARFNKDWGYLKEQSNEERVQN